MMESRDLASVSRLVSRPIFASLVLVSKVSGFETLNIAKKCLIKISVIQRFFLLYLQVKNNPNTSEKCQKFEKK